MSRVPWPRRTLPCVPSFVGISLSREKSALAKEFPRACLPVDAIALNVVMSAERSSYSLPIYERAVTDRNYSIDLVTLFGILSWSTALGPPLSLICFENPLGFVLVPAVAESNRVLLVMSFLAGGTHPGD